MTFGVGTCGNANFCNFPEYQNTIPLKYRNNLELDWDNNLVNLTSLKHNKWYQTDYYKFRNGSYLTSVIKKTNDFGELTLENHPQLFSNNQVMYFIIKEVSKPKSMQNDFDYGEEDISLEQSNLCMILDQSNVVQITYNSELQKIYNYEVYNSLGKLIMLVENKNLIDFNNQPSGLYFIVNSETGETYKAMKL